MQKNILLPTDFSDNAWNAIVYALKLYANEVCTFYILHSLKIKASTMTNLTSKLFDTMAKNAMKELVELQEMAQTVNVNANHEFKVVLSKEDLSTALKITIKNHRIDIVIIGTKGSTAAKELFFGSNTLKVIKHLRLCPVLVIPENFDFVVPKQIAFPTDFNHFYEDKEIKPLKELVELYDSAIRIVHIAEEDKLSEVQNYNLTMLKGYLYDYSYTLHWMANYTKKATEINDFIKELKIDMLAMVNYKHGFIEGIVKEPVIKKIGFHPMVPFLVIPN
ncbi:universal stress protein [Tenacibaculum caenipelagi]|uniref:Nucleotide-binding universal stress UspA family protein n=1 Tax=Tenacibaculum caenipelagi TaxID=1325435 RepID=A0A4R6TDL7_9FLAO|nr:universal stress protein [Tenacibaculum caenipelagi]TDQ21958.1 nucleotide-binding universal stress UspA family protein [Tenacibaculum caenipelagi]